MHGPKLPIVLDALAAAGQAIEQCLDELKDGLNQQLDAYAEQHGMPASKKSRVRKPKQKNEK